MRMSIPLGIRMAKRKRESMTPLHGSVPRRKLVHFTWSPWDRGPQEWVNDVEDGHLLLLG